VIERDGRQLAVMTYSRGSPTLVIIDHTEVGPEFQGHGVGRKLLNAAVAWARETGTKLMATCPFALSQFQGDPTIRDVMK
jgi:predicted GNAT family acetyltransferase